MAAGRDPIDAPLGACAQPGRWSEGARGRSFVTASADLARAQITRKTIEMPLLRRRHRKLYRVTSRPGHAALDPGSCCVVSPTMGT